MTSFITTFSTGTVLRYRAEKNAPMKQQRVDDDPVVPGMACAIDVNWLPDVARKTKSSVDLNCRRYHVIVGDDAYQPADVPTDVVDDLGDVFAQDSKCEADGGSSSTANDRLFIAPALTRLPKTVSI